MDKFAAMACFERVAACGGFSAAARELGRSKAAVSRLVAELEAALGVQLLVRTTRQVRLTEAGQVYRERCRQLLADLADLEGRVRREDAALEGLLRVTAPRSFAELYLAPFAAHFMTRHPGLVLDLALSDDYVDLVQEATDVAIRVGALEDSSLVARRLAVTRVVCCGAPAYFARCGRPRRVQDLQAHVLVADANIRQGGQWRFAGGRGIRVRGRVQVNSALFVRELLLEGAGIGLVPEFAVAAALTSGQLEALPFVYEPRELGVYALYPHRRHLATRLRVLVDALVAWFEGGLEARRAA
ncbi:MAG: LysR family transcriptional regulator [Gammaproteobacteria bacterium]|nr:LysR family transcriptional regulator [Gammaproteobacteria bacterium]